MMATWTALVNNTINKGFLSNNQPTEQQQKKEKGAPNEFKGSSPDQFFCSWGEVAISIFGVEVHVFSGVALIDLFSVQVISSHLAAPAFSPTSCCLTFVWHDYKSDTCVLCIVRIPPVTTSISLMWNRHLADRLSSFLCSKPGYVYLLFKFHCASSLLVFCVVLSQDVPQQKSWPAWQW
jgi:hypothetical protein